MNPTLSVITVSYNAETEIEKTIQSVLAQTFTDYEYIFIDGGSKDKTVAIMPVHVYGNFCNVYEISPIVLC